MDDVARGFDAWVTWCARLRHLRVGIGRVAFRRGVVERGLMRRLVEGWRIAGLSPSVKGRYCTALPLRTCWCAQQL